MRYYSILLFNSYGTQYKSYNSQNKDGTPIMEALNVELDLQVVDYSVATNSSFVRIWGIPIQDIGQAAQLTGDSIQVWAGFQKGLPLAKYNQAGLIASGRVVQAFANWVGTDMTLDMIITSDFGTKYTPSNIVVNWQQGQTLTQALKQTLQLAYAGYQVDINISSNLMLPTTVTHCCANLNQLAQFVNSISYDIMGNSYTGISITMTSNKISIWDDNNISITQPSVAINFTDLMGQPTWIRPGTLQITCPMRADISLNSHISLPSTPIITTLGSLNAVITGGIMQSSVFQGQSLRVTGIRHTGNFRSPDAHAWVTVIDASLTSQENVYTPLTQYQPLGSLTEITVPTTLASTPIVQAIL